MPVVLALDLGTTSTAAIAVDAEGTLVNIVRRDHRADIAGLPTGHAEQDPQRHLATAVEVLRELSASLDDEPACLGMTGQMHSMIAVDAERRPLSNLITWQDRRANEIASTGLTGERSFLDEYLRRCDDSDLSDTGCRLSAGYAAVTLFTMQQRNELPPAMVTATLLADWVAAELADAEIVTERSHAASTGVYDMKHDDWSAALIDAGELKADWFPRVVDCRHRVGTLCGRFANESRLPVGLPIVVPIGDNQASVIGSLPDDEPAIQMTIGTGGQMNWPLDTFTRIEGMDTRPLPDRRFLAVGAGLAGGDAYAWVNRTMRNWLSAFGVEKSADDVFAVLNELASAVPVEVGGLRCEPFFRGTRRDPHRRGILTGIGDDNFSPGQLARAVLQGIARAFHDLRLSAIDGNADEISRIIGCGNGIEQNPLLCQILAETFDMALWTPRHREGAAFGAALLAGVAIGLWPDLASISHAIELRQICSRPDKMTHEAR